MATYETQCSVSYVCSCGSKFPICKLYFCRHCLKLRCGDCVCHEVDSHYCPNCLESLPSAEAKLKKNRCGNCFDCPSCQHTLSTRATTVPVPNPDDPSKTVPKKVYYLACGFCRWTSRDVGLADQTVASGGWIDQENPHNKRLSSILEYYRQLAQKEKAEKERRKYTRRRSYMHFSDQIAPMNLTQAKATLDEKYGLTSVAARKRASITAGIASISLKEGEEVKVSEVTPSVASEEVEELDERFLTEPLLLAGGHPDMQVPQVTTMKQRLSSTEFQPEDVKDLYPIHKHLLIKRSQRCRECEHNLSKPEFSPASIRFKIQLVALYFVPEVKILALPKLQYLKESRVILSMFNPADYISQVFVRPRENANDYLDTAIMKVPLIELQLAARDDTAEFDDGLTSQQQFKDNPEPEMKDPDGVIVFRKANKIGFYTTVTPQKPTGDVKGSFIIRYTHHNMTNALHTKEGEAPEPEVVWMEHPVLLNFGPITHA
ncbi:dynactin subunit 4-like isoform X3 [Lineus longissimus]|uniref:dynactin subunit 4-like isoform X3 n=1 Tax=Lineus longissimus TaxID=88925 RepID=UPI002B4F9320